MVIVLLVYRYCHMDTDIANQFLLIQQKFNDIDNRLIDLSNRVQSIDEHRSNLCTPGITQ